MGADQFRRSVSGDDRLRARAAVVDWRSDEASDHDVRPTAQILAGCIGGTSMSEFVIASAFIGGGELQITSDVERFACAYCGKEHLQERRWHHLDSAHRGWIAKGAGCRRQPRPNWPSCVCQKKSPPWSRIERANWKRSGRSQTIWLTTGQIKEARAERLTAILRLGLFAVPTSSGGVRCVWQSDFIVLICWLPFLWVILTQVPRLTKAVREVEQPRTQAGTSAVENRIREGTTWKLGARTAVSPGRLRG